MAQITLPFPTFVAGTTIVASQTNANNAAILAQVNGNIDNSNVAAAAAIALSKLGLNPGSPAFNRTISGGQTWGNGLTTDTIPQVVMISDGGLQFGAGGASALDVALKRSAANTLRLATPAAGAAILDMNNGTIINYAGTAPEVIYVDNAASPYTITKYYAYIRCDCTAGAITLVMPDILTDTQAMIMIEKVDTTTNAVTVTPHAGETILGASTFILQAPEQQYSFMPALNGAGVGTNWEVAADHDPRALVFGANAFWNIRPFPTSGSGLSGDYYTQGNWTQTGAISGNNLRLFFGGSVTINNTFTITTENPGGVAVANGGGSGVGLGGGVGAFFANGGSSLAGGGGGGHGGNGGNGGSFDTAIPAGGLTYGIYTMLTGSGGGAGWNAGGAGGAGGGSLYLEAAGPITFDAAAAVTATGAAGATTAAGSTGCGGGGSGGGIQVRCLKTVTLIAGSTISAAGGAGGSSATAGTFGGGGGGGGIIDIHGDASSVNAGTISAAGGAAGTGASGNGTAGSAGTTTFSTTVYGRRIAN